MMLMDFGYDATSSLTSSTCVTSVLSLMKMNSLSGENAWHASSSTSHGMVRVMERSGNASILDDCRHLTPEGQSFSWLSRLAQAVEVAEDDEEKPENQSGDPCRHRGRQRRQKLKLRQLELSEDQTSHHGCAGWL